MNFRQIAKKVVGSSNQSIVIAVQPNGSYKSGIINDFEVEKTMLKMLPLAIVDWKVTDTEVAGWPVSFFSYIALYKSGKLYTEFYIKTL